jgi:hypothetical protein
MQLMADEIRERSASVKETTATLFGEEEKDRNLFLERNVLKANIRAKLSAEANLFGAVSTEAKAKTLERGGNVVQAGANKAIAQEASQHKAALDKLINLKGPISDAFNEAAMDLFHAPRKRR